MSERRRSRRAEKSTSDQRTPSQNYGRPVPRVETSYMLRKPSLPRSSNRAACSNSNPNSSNQIEAGAESKNVISKQRVWRSPHGGAHGTAQDRLRARASYGSRDWSGDTTQRNGSTHGAGTTSEAIAFFQNCLRRGITTDSSTYIKVLQMCLRQKGLLAAKQVHECIIQSGMEKNPYVATTLLNVSVKCGELLDARRVFYLLEKKGVITWTTMIAGYAKSDDAESALEHFKSMRQEGVQPN